MVILGNVIALIAIWGSILDRISSFLGIRTTALCALMISDYFIVRRRQAADPGEIERVNWAGVIAMLGASSLGYWLQDSRTTSLGFLVALIVCPVVYAALQEEE